MSRIGRILMFVTASVVSGLALAFIIVAWRPELLREQAAPAVAVASSPPAGSDPLATPIEKSSAPPVQEGDSATVLFPGHDAWSYADAVQRAAPAVVNISSSWTVTERVQPNGFEAFFGDQAPRYFNRTEHSLGRSESTRLNSSHYSRSRMPSSA